MFGLGKKRTKFGKFVDKHLGYGGQERIRETTKLNRDTVSKACSDKEYIPSGKTMRALLKAVRELTGRDVRSDDFWDM